jgi:peptidoglycan hydrolase-like protein with peptidoglycan-binding domain
MKNITVAICLTIAVLLGSAGYEVKGNYSQDRRDYDNGDSYNGERWNGKRHGQGTYTYGPSSKWAGDKYVGEWEDGKMHGQGTYTYANGLIEEGIWKDNYFQGSGKGGKAAKKQAAIKSNTNGVLNAYEAYKKAAETKRPAEKTRKEAEIERQRAEVERLAELKRQQAEEKREAALARKAAETKRLAAKAAKGNRTDRSIWKGTEWEKRYANYIDAWVYKIKFNDSGDQYTVDITGPRAIVPCSGSVKKDGTLIPSSCESLIGTNHLGALSRPHYIFEISGNVDAINIDAINLDAGGTDYNFEQILNFVTFDGLKRKMSSVGRKAAETKRLAEKTRKEAEVERQRKAELARLAAESKALKEAQRDRLGEAFDNRSQADRQAIQQRLFERGFYKSTVDGSFGTGTRVAIENYARKNNQIDLKSSEGATTIIAQLIALPPGRAPLDLSKRANAKVYLEDIREFVSLNPKELDPLLLGGSYSPAMQEVQNQTFNKIGSNFLRLVAFTKKSSLFREFLQAKLKTRFDAEKKVRTAISKVIVEQINALKTRLSANPLAPDAFQLSQLINKYQKVPKGKNADALKVFRSSLENDLKKLGVSVANAPTSTSGNTGPAKLSMVDLKALSDVEAKDIVILVNLTKSAPHAYRKLSGEIAFETKKVNACAPSLGLIKAQYRAFYEAALQKALNDHTFKTDQRCRDGLKGHDALIVTGADLARSQDIPPADALVAALNKKVLARLVTVKYSDFTRELAKREILSDQYESDIREGARVGFGALAFAPNAQVGCTVVKGNLAGHDQSIDAVLSALQFLNGAAIKKTTNVSVDVAFRQTQKERCAFIYGSGKTLKKILDASAGAGITPTVLPVWTSTSVIAKRAKKLQSNEANKTQSKANRLARLKQRQAEEASKRTAKAGQLEERQKRYRLKNGAKVASLVSSIDASLKDVRVKVDSALGKQKNLSSAVSSADFWGGYPAWYADKRMKGWDFDSTVPTPKDYGVAEWNGRAVESVIAQIRVLMKNRTLGKYSDDCWNVGYLVDKEFSMKREPFTRRCKDDDALKTWQTGHSFKTRWDLGIK